MIQHAADEEEADGERQELFDAFPVMRRAADQEKLADGVREM